MKRKMRGCVVVVGIVLAAVVMFGLVSSATASVRVTTDLIDYGSSTFVVDRWLFMNADYATRTAAVNDACANARVIGMRTTELTLSFFGTEGTDPATTLVQDQHYQGSVGGSSAKVSISAGTHTYDTWDGITWSRGYGLFVFEDVTDLESIWSSSSLSSYTGIDHLGNRCTNFNYETRWTMNFSSDQGAQSFSQSLESCGLSLVAIPEPASISLLVLGSFGLLRRRRTH